MSLDVSITHLAKAFGDKVVLSDVSLEVPAGRSTVLIGPSASGKSVLIRCILGLMERDAGAVRIGGIEVADTRRIGVLFQQNALFDSMKVWENVAFPLINSHDMPAAEARDRSIARLLDVGLTEEMAMLYPVELSGGMQKRVGVARAMAGNPELLILDDPTAGLDPILTNAILDLIEASVEADVEGRGATVLAITGNMHAARTRFDRIAMLYDGVIRWQGDSADAGKADDPYLAQMLEGRAEGPIRMRLTD
jgi:phospholipid/cholesterol/gamma-HCH transport system ATP-binding protein